jgi:DNA gyrase/topoisomerase IV subunit B
MEIDSQYDESEIVVLDAIDAIRCHTNLYLGQLERDDLFDDIIFESLCHAIDEAIDNSCKYIKIDIDRIGIVHVKYDASISLKVANTFFTTRYACHNLKKHIEVGSKYCQHGLVLLNAICSEFQVDIIHNGQWGRQTYLKGKAERDMFILNTDEIDRTQFRFRFDEELLGKHEIHLNRLQIKAEELMSDFGITIEIASVENVMID